MNSLDNSSCFLFTFLECPKIFCYKTGNTNGNSDSFGTVFSIVGTGKQQCSFPHLNCTKRILIDMFSLKVMLDH